MARAMTGEPGIASSGSLHHFAVVITLVCIDEGTCCLKPWNFGEVGRAEQMAETAPKLLSPSSAKLRAVDPTLHKGSSVFSGLTTEGRQWSWVMKRLARYSDDNGRSDEPG